MGSSVKSGPVPGPIVQLSYLTGALACLKPHALARIRHGRHSTWSGRHGRTIGNCIKSACSCRWYARRLIGCLGRTARLNLNLQAWGALASQSVSMISEHRAYRTWHPRGFTPS